MLLWSNFQYCIGVVRIEKTAVLYSPSQSTGNRNQIDTEATVNESSFLGNRQRIVHAKLQNSYFHKVRLFYINM